MRSKTSCCNAAVFKKNMTRFAPVWILYTLCLMVGVVLSYSNGGEYPQYWFGYHYGSIIQMMGLANLGYGLLIAQLLFGDLFNSRMCNALHAMPLRRETWFGTNVLSGIAMSLIPTLVMALLSLMLMSGSVFTNADQVVWMTFLGSNLQFVCFFGIAAFCAMCTANRFAMTAGFGLVNFGAAVVFFLVDTIYTPMLYGIITPSVWANRLTPLVQMTSGEFFRTDVTRGDVIDKMGKLIPDAQAAYVLTESWMGLWVCAGAGILFGAAALALYRRRDLECAGDAVAFPVLKPVFQVPCAIVVAAASQFLLENFIGYMESNFLMLSFGLTVGWFIGKMLTARSTRVFQLKNFVQLGILAAVIAATLVATKLDVLNLTQRQPKLEDIKEIHFGTNQTPDFTLTEPEDFETVLRIQKLALEDRVENFGTHHMDSGAPAAVTGYDAASDSSEKYFYAANIHIVYRLKNGSTMNRRYNIWADQEEGDLTRSILSRWDNLDENRITSVNGKPINVLNYVLGNFKGIYVDGASEEALEAIRNVEAAKELVAAIQADCEDGTMAQDSYLHNGIFRKERKGSEESYNKHRQIYISLDGGDYSWSARIYPDSENTLAWLREHNLFSYEIVEENMFN